MNICASDEKSNIALYIILSQHLVTVPYFLIFIIVLMRTPLSFVVFVFDIPCLRYSSAFTFLGCERGFKMSSFGPCFFLSKLFVFMYNLSIPNNRPFICVSKNRGGWWVFWTKKIPQIIWGRIVCFNSNMYQLIWNFPWLWQCATLKIFPEIFFK